MDDFKGRDNWSEWLATKELRWFEECLGDWPLMIKAQGTTAIDVGTMGYFKACIIITSLL